MAKRTKNKAKIRLLAAALAVVVFAACNSNTPPEKTGAGGQAGTSARGGGSGAAGSDGGTGAAGGRGGGGATGGGSAGGGGAPGAGGGTGGPSGGGTGGSNNGGSGGRQTGGRGGAANGGGDGASACTRELLRSTIAAYFTALAAHSAATLPVAANVKFTENGKAMALGDGLWRTAGAVKYTQSALDVELCSSGTHAVVPEGSMDIPVALRLKLQNQMITEIETIAVRPGD